MPNFDPDKKIKANKRNKNQNRTCYNNLFESFFHFFKDKVIAKSKKKQTLKNKVFFK